MVSFKESWELVSRPDRPAMPGFSWIAGRRNLAGSGGNRLLPGKRAMGNGRDLFRSLSHRGWGKPIVYQGN